MDRSGARSLKHYRIGVLSIYCSNRGTSEGGYMNRLNSAQLVRATVSMTESWFAIEENRSAFTLNGLKGANGDKYLLGG